MPDADLRNIFTAYMQKVVHNARIDYIRRRIAEHKPQHEPLTQDILYEQNFGLASEDGFDFGEGRLADNFASLSPIQKKILILLIAQGLTAKEAARELRCPVDYIYAQKRQALEKLRKRMEGRDGAV